MILARGLDEGGLDELARSLWKTRQLPPSWLDERTPHEILFLFGGETSEDGEPVDAAAELHRVNHRNGAWHPPVIPSWLMPGVPRGS